MATKVSRATALNPVTTLREHLTLKAEAATITTRSNALKDRLKKWFPAAKDVYENENGSKFYDLDQTLTVAGQAYKGMELRRSVTTTFDETVAESILRRKKVLEQALSTYVDQDKVYRLLQEGKVTEADIDKMMTEKESWAFWPVKGEVL